MKSNEKSGGELIEEPSEEPIEEAGRGKKGEFEYESINCLLLSE